MRENVTAAEIKNIRCTKKQIDSICPKTSIKLAPMENGTHFIKAVSLFRYLPSTFASLFFRERFSFKFILPIFTE